MRDFSRFFYFKYVLILGGLFLILVLAGREIYFGYQAANNGQNLPPLASGEVRVYFEFGDGEERIFDGPTVEGMNVFDVLRQSAKAGHFDLEFAADKGKIFVGAINGLRNETDAVWMFYINGRELPQELLEVQRVRPGDVVLARYISQ